MCAGVGEPNMQVMFSQSPGPLYLLLVTPSAVASIFSFLNELLWVEWMLMLIVLWACPYKEWTLDGETKLIALAKQHRLEI